MTPGLHNIHSTAQIELAERELTVLDGRGASPIENTASPKVKPTFSQHLCLARAWCRWLTMSGTEKQGLRMMARFTPEQLIAFLTDQGQALPLGCEALKPDQVGAR